jgi:hypothetical protein
MRLSWLLPSLAPLARPCFISNHPHSLCCGVSCPCSGNDARYTMEAFLALTGHPPCSDPLQAHLDFASQDARYQRQIEASMAAAAALGWATPGTPSPGPGTPVGVGGSSPHGNNSSGAVAAAAPGFGSRPGSNGQQQQIAGAWGAGAAADRAGVGRAVGGAASAGAASAGGGGAWGASKQQGGGNPRAPGSNAWGAAPQQQQKSGAGCGAFNSTVDTAREAVAYDPNPDGW